MKWRVGSSTHGCWLGTYEREYHGLIRSLVRSGMTVYDVGAHAGYYTLAFSRLARRVYAFEPMPENAANLSTHVTLNCLENVSVIVAAVSDRSGSAQMSRNVNSLTGYLSATGTVTVPAVALDELDIPAPDLIKVDVEGAEHLVLRGASKLLKQCHAIWLVDMATEEAECIRRFKESGYKVRFVGRMILAEPMADGGWQSVN